MIALLLILSAIAHAIAAGILVGIAQGKLGKQWLYIMAGLAALAALSSLLIMLFKGKIIGMLFGKAVSGIAQAPIKLIPGI